MKLHKFIQRICAATVASALTLSLCTPVLAEGIAALPAPTSGTSQPDETGDVPIDPAHFPDENFRKYLGQKAIDDDKNGILSQTEREKVTAIVLHSAGNISDLTGIKYFPNLKELYCNGGDLANLDVSQNTKLTNLYCYNNQLTSLDVSENTKLTELDCSDNQLANLDVSENPELTYLKCGSNQLTRLDLHVNTALETLICDNNQLTSLNLSSNTALTQVYCSDNKRQIAVGETGQFDLSALKGFDPDRAVWPEGVTVENGILTVPYNTTSLTYRYDVRGNGADDDYKEFVLTFDEVKEPDLPDDSSAPADTGSTAGGAIAAVAVGGAAVWGGYELVTRVMLHSLLPEGAAIPASRGQLALLVWNTAGRPEPVNAPAFADVTDPDTARAAQWCVEQGLLTLKKDGSFDPDGWTPKFRVIQVWNKAFPKQ